MRAQLVAPRPHRSRVYDDLLAHGAEPVEAGAVLAAGFEVQVAEVGDGREGVVGEIREVEAFAVQDLARRPEELEGDMRPAAATVGAELYRYYVKARRRRHDVELEGPARLEIERLSRFGHVRRPRRPEGVPRRPVQTVVRE